MPVTFRTNSKGSQLLLLINLLSVASAPDRYLKACHGFESVGFSDVFFNLSRASEAMRILPLTTDENTSLLRLNKFCSEKI